MSNPNDGGPAFPRPGSKFHHPNQDFPEFINAQDGMTLRDYFAAKAMAALIVAPGRIGDEVRMNDEKLACWAYQAADAMLAAKSTKQKP